MPKDSVNTFQKVSSRRNSTFIFAYKMAYRKARIQDSGGPQRDPRGFRTLGLRTHILRSKNQLTSLEKQQVTDRPNKVSNQYQSNHYQNNQQDNQHHRHNNNHQSEHHIHDDIGQRIQYTETNQLKEQVSKKLHVGNLNKYIAEKELNQFFGLKISVRLVVVK